MHTRPANTADLTDVTTSFIAAFEPDPISTFFHPHRHVHPESYRRWTLDDIKMQLLAPGSVVVVAETDPEDPEADGRKQIAGTAIWREWGSEKAALQQEMQKSSYAQIFERFLLSLEVKYYMFFHLNRSLDFAHLKLIMGERPIALEPERWHLHNLSVDPRFQGQGVGTVLVDEGKERACRDGTCVQLFCGDHNKKWYERRGLKEVGRLPEGEMELEVGELGWAMGWYPDKSS